MEIQNYSQQRSNIPIIGIQKLDDFKTNPDQTKFPQLLRKLTELSKTVETHAKFQKYYGMIGLNRQIVIDGLKAIYQYFVLLGDQLQKGLIRKQIGIRLVQGVHDYLQLEKFQQLDPKNKAIYILQFQTKFSVCLQFFNTIKEQQSNITSQPKQKFQDVWNDIQIVSIGDKNQIQKKYSFVKKMLIITTTAILSQEEVQWSMAKKIFFGLSYPRYMVDYPTARMKSFVFYKYPTIKMAKQIWNIPEMGASKQFIKIAFESIKVNRKIYIPMQFGQQDFPDIFVPAPKTIQVRVLHHEVLFIKNKIKNKSKIICCNGDDLQDPVNQIDTILVHMHGGGFIALSSRMMQTMTRRWANKLKIPIFSIDYRKPPTDPFPAAPNDCLSVYKFIVNKIRNYMNINPKNIYLAGDSAGGNLVCGLTGNIILHKLTIPKAIYLAYPAADLRIIFSPSRIHAVTDPLLWPSMLLLCLHQYMGNQIQNSNHPLASPILLTQEFVGGQKGDKRFPLSWPKTMIVVGQNDPLYDDSLLLMQKMKQSNIDCKCRVYAELSHGFLSTNFMISQCQQTLKDSIQDLKRLIGKDIKQPKLKMSK